MNWLRSRLPQALSWNRTPKWVSAALVIAALLLVVRVAAAWRGRVHQPIAFSHRAHTETMKLDCEMCHPFVKIGAHPGLPALETCSTCHSAVQGTTAESRRVTEYVTANRPLVFVKLFRLPHYVFYTHRRHVGIAGLTCRTCHGDIASSTTPPVRPLVTIKMQFCLDCHLKMRQTTDCVACHR